MQPFGHNRYGPKIGGSTPFGGMGDGSPSNTMWPVPRPTSLPSFILIRPTVWPQCTNVTYGTDRQTGQTYRQDRQRTDSIGRTVLQTVAQKHRSLSQKRSKPSVGNSNVHWPRNLDRERSASEIVSYRARVKYACARIHCTCFTYCRIP